MGGKERISWKKSGKSDIQLADEKRISICSLYEIKPHKIKRENNV